MILKHSTNAFVASVPSCFTVCMPIITICSSANFYRQAAEIQDQLEKSGFKVILPSTANKMKETGDYEVDHYKTWFADPNDYHKKAKLMRDHFAEIERGDAVLVVNHEKRGQPNYIGGNVLMEMSLAFYLGKPIFILNEVPGESPFLEEIIGMEPIALCGAVDDLPKKYQALSDS